MRKGMKSTEYTTRTTQVLNSWRLWLLCNVKSMWKTANGFHSAKWSIVLSFSFQLSLSEVVFLSPTPTPPHRGYCFSHEALKCCRKESEDRGSQSWEWAKGRWLLKDQAKRELMRKRENRVPVLCTVSWCLSIRGKYYKMLLHYLTNCIPQLRFSRLLLFGTAVKGFPFMDTPLDFISHYFIF